MQICYLIKLMSETQINAKVNSKIDQLFRNTVRQNKEPSLKAGLTKSMLDFIKKHKN